MESVRDATKFPVGVSRISRQIPSIEEIDFKTLTISLDTMPRDFFLFFWRGHRVFLTWQPPEQTKKHPSHVTPRETQPYSLAFPNFVDVV